MLYFTNSIGASIGVAISRNVIGTSSNPLEVQAYIKDSTIIAADNLTLRAISNQTIDAIVVAGSVAASGGGVATE